MYEHSVSASNQVEFLNNNVLTNFPIKVRVLSKWQAGY